MVGAAIAGGVGRAGFRVEQVEVTGLKRMDKMTVYAVALDQQSRAMPLVDLEDVRQKLLRYGWNEDAHVSRRMPDTLLIQIDEGAEERRVGKVCDITCNSRGVPNNEKKK